VLERQMTVTIPRRKLITLLGSAVVAWPRAVGAQQKKLPRIGALVLGNADAAHVRAEAAISTRNGLTVDFADFAIAALRWCQVKLWPNWLAATLSDRISAVTLPDPARAIRDDHHDLEHFQQSRRGPS
jgi:hypothetical protein